MTLAAELELPTFDHTDATLRGDRYRAAMAGVRGHDGWLAAGPFGFIVLDREAGEFFLRTKDAVFPGLTIADLFGIGDGPLHEEIVKNIISVNGEDHRRLPRGRSIAIGRGCAAFWSGCWRMCHRPDGASSLPRSPSRTRRW
jgi:hypothetical protein